MTTVADEAKVRTYEGRELTTSDVVECAHRVEQLAVATFIARTRVTETAVREWLSTNRPGTETTRQEFDEAVRRYLITRWDV